MRFEGEHDDRRLPGAERARLRDGDLEVGQELQKKRLELVVRAIDLIDEQHGARRCAQRCEERALDEKRFVVQIHVALAGPGASASICAG